MTKYLFSTILAIGILFTQCAFTRADEPVALRGYGTVSAAFAPGRAAFACESPEKAEILQGKLLADLLWDATDTQRAGEEVDVDGIPTIPRHSQRKPTWIYNRRKSAALPENSHSVLVVKGIAIAGDDHKWYWANTKIDGNTVLAWSDQLPNPVAVRYGWADNPPCDLYNKEKLPAAPFRTDRWDP